VRLLLPFKQDLDKEDEDRNMPLHKAVKSGSKIIIRLLIESSCFKDPEDAMLNTPVLIAEMEGFYTISDYLLDKGADVKCCNKKLDFLLWPNILRGNTERIKVLVDKYKIDINKGYGRHKITALHKVILQGNETNCLSIIPVLISLGADVNAKTDDEKTPLFYAVYRNFGEVVKLLLQNKASASHLDKAGNCILHFVKDLDICGNCIKAGAKLSTMNKQGNFPLHAAFAFLGTDNIVTKYIANIMDKELVAIKNKNGYTAAECAALSESEKKNCITLCK